METDVGSGELIAADHATSAEAVDMRSRRKRWLIISATVFVVLAGAITTLGVVLGRTHQQAVASGDTDAAAIAAAKDCVSATQPPSAAALPASQAKLIACSTGDFATQAQWYGAVLDEAYQAVNVRVQVPDMHAAVERHNGDGSIIALVAFRAVISQPGMADRENGYRVRVRMVAENGTFKMSNLDQVAQ